MKINTEDIEIKLCTLEDVDSVYELQNIIIDYFKEEEKGYFLPFDKKEYERIIENPKTDGEIYGVFFNHQMIAWGFLSVSNRMEELKKQIPEIDGRCADLDGIIVHPEYRGNHLQEILMKHLENRAKELGIKYLVAEITYDNKYSLENTLKLGYSIKTSYIKDGKIKRYIVSKNIEKR